MSELIEINLRGSRQLEEFRLRRTPLVDVYLEPLGHLRDGIAKTRRELDRDERILYGLGRLVFEDFTEVVVNCANGLTTGAMKIQRGMYERTVTLLCLDQNPSEIEKFLNFFPIADWKKIQEARRVMPDSVPAEFYEQKKLEYEAVRQAYMVPACRVCSSARKKAAKGHLNPAKAPALTESLPCMRFREIIRRFKLLMKRPEGDEKPENSLQPDPTHTVPGCIHQRVNHAWSDLDVVAMSEKLEGFKDIRFLAYYTNMEETHSTVHAILRRFTAEDETGVTYSEGHLPEYEGMLLLLAHHLVMSAAEVLRNRFGDGQADNQLWELCVKHLREHAASIAVTNNGRENEER